MPQSNERHAEWMRERRGAQTTEVHREGAQYPALLYALTDPIKRHKLEKVYRSLKDFKQEKNVFYGYPAMIPFDVAGDLLEATR